MVYRVCARELRMVCRRMQKVRRKGYCDEIGRKIMYDSFIEIWEG